MTIRFAARKTIPTAVQMAADVPISMPCHDL